MGRTTYRHPAVRTAVLRAAVLRAAAVCALALAATACASSPSGTPSGSAAPYGLAVQLTATDVTLTWAVAPTPEPASFDVEARVAGTGTWGPGQGALDVVARRYSAPLPQLDTPLPLEVRVTSVFRDGTRSAASTPVAFELPGPATSTRFSFGDEQLVADHDRLAAAGLDTFPDGLMSVLPTGTPGTYDWYANQGATGDGQGGAVPAGIAHVRGTLSDPAAATVTSRGAIVGVIGNPDYVGAGAVWKDPTSGGAVMLYHRELYDRDAQGAPTGAFWSSIGAAWSADGVTFQDLGEVITPDIDRSSPNRGPSGNGPGDVTLVVRDGSVYAYFNDNLDDGTMVLAVARTTVDEMRAAAAGAAAPVFHKLGEGGFTEPGVGGTPVAVSRGFNPSVVRDGCTGGYLMVSFAGGDEGGTRLQLATSVDGLTWSAPELVPGQLSGFRIYNTLVGDQVAGDGQVTASGGQLRLLSVRFASPTDFWSQAALYSVRLHDTACPAA